MNFDPRAVSLLERLNQRDIPRTWWAGAFVMPSWERRPTITT